MKIFRITLLFVLSSFASLAQKQSPFKLRFVPTLLFEQHRAFAIRHNQNFNYEFKKGAGADLRLLYTKAFNNKRYTFEFGPSIGQYLFTDKKLIEYRNPQSFGNNHLVSTASAYFSIGNWTQEKIRQFSGFYFNFHAQIGIAYVQHGHYDQSIRNYRQTKNNNAYYSCGASFWWIRKNAKIFPVLKIGFHYTRIGSKNFNGAFFI